MSKLADYFHTDWAAMTAQDWAGVIITVGAFVGVVITFAWALRPSKRKELEAQKYRVLHDDEE